MDLKLFATVFVTVLLAELGDKTQLATALYASRGADQLLIVFVGASSALIVSTAVAVGVGGWLGARVDPRWLSLIAGTGFVAIGLWILWQAWTGH